MVTRAVDLLANGMEVDPGYAGPRMEQEDDGHGKKRAKITQRYIDEMRTWFKDGKVGGLCEPQWTLIHPC